MILILAKLLIINPNNFFNNYIYKSGFIIFIFILTIILIYIIFFLE